MKIKSISFLAFLLIGTFAGCDDKGNIPTDIVASAKTAKPQALPQFNLITSTGKNINITVDKENWKFQGLEGKAVLLDFFGTWCPPCKAEIPHLNNIRKNMKGKFEIIGIDIGSRSGQPTPQKELKDFIENFNIKYPITTKGDNSVLFGAVSNLNKRGSIPFMILFNTKGQYVTHYVGMVPEEMIQSDINKILGK